MKAARWVVCAVGIFFWLALDGLAFGQPMPFVDPPFRGLCTVRHFEEAEAPPIEGFADEPLCVEYEKRDITGTNGGAIRFLAAEPARFAIAIPKCRYWQQDHWRIQLAPGDTPIIGWDGSYWFDKGNGSGGARLKNFTIAGQPSGPDDVADLIQLLDPELAAVIRMYGEGPSGGGGASICMEIGDPSCAPPPCESDDPCTCAAAATRAAADAQCDCTAARNHGSYVQCVADVANADVAAGRLPRECRGDIVKCASRSTCGKPGFSTCCRTDARGKTKCHVKRDGRCRAPRGGHACAGTKSSCCDACVSGGCASGDAPPTCS